MIGKNPRAEETDCPQHHQAADKLAALATGIGQAAYHHHANGTTDVRDRREQPDDHRALSARATNQLRRPEVQSIRGNLDQEVNQPQCQETGNTQCGQ